MMKFGVVQPVKWLEDVRLVQGQGHFQDDRVLPGQVYTVFLRSPHAHAKITSIDVAAARAAPGVLAVYTGADYAPTGWACRRRVCRASGRMGRPCLRRSVPRLLWIGCAMSAIRWRWWSPIRWIMRKTPLN
jgi:carbon-monoxide dehydrogenase large subunit